MPPEHRKPALFIGILALLAGILVALRMSGPHVSTPPEVGGTVFNAPRPLPEVTLVDQTGAAFAPGQLAGHWSLLFFGFTHCPDVCPTTLTTLAQAVAQLGDLPPARRPRVYMISVDPGRDDPARMAEYVSYFDPQFVGVTGDPEAVDALAKGLGVAYAYVPREDGSYSVDHTAAIFVLDPDGSLVALLSTPHSATGIARDFRAITDFLETDS